MNHISTTIWELMNHISNTLIFPILGTDEPHLKYSNITILTGNC